MSATNSIDPHLQYLKGGGEMGALIRSYNWSDHQLGTPENWSQSLLTTLSIILNAKFPMFLWWGPDLIQFYNDAYRPSMGNEGKHPKALGQKGEDCWTEIWPVIKPLIDQVMAGGESVFFENQLIPIYRNNKLEEVYWTFGYSRVNDESGNPAGVLVICNETTEQVKFIQEIKSTKEELEFAIHAAELGTWDYNPTNNTFICNDRLKLWFGLEVTDEVPLSLALSKMAIEDRERVIAAIQLALTYESGGYYDIDYAIIDDDNTHRYVRAKGRTFFDENKQAIRLSGTLQDITNERKATEELKESSQRLELAVEAANLGSYDLNLETGRIISNAQYLANFGIFNRVEMDPMELINAILPEYRSQIIAKRAEAISNHTIYHAKYPVQWPDGSVHWIHAYGKPVYDHEDKAIRIIGISSDITRQVNAQQGMEQAYEQLRLSREAAQLGTFDMDLRAGTMEWDERCRTLFGINHNDAVTYEQDFLNGLHPDDRDRVVDVIEKVFIKSITNGHYDIQYRTVGQEDQKIRWVRAKGRTYFDEQDRPLRFIGSVLDITEQKSDELRKNDFISMVSHELKTPLTSLKAYIQMLMMDLHAVKEGFMEEALIKANNQIERMSSLINGFLNVSRLESGKLQLNKEYFDLTELLTEILEDVKLISPTHHIKLNGCDMGMVYADRDKIGSVVSNLLSNAVKYSPKESLIEVDCNKDQHEIKISVRDLGCGINEEDLEKLFERFYRVENTNNKYISGFGIGLYLSSEIINGHQGKIWAESALDRGSTFHFTIPVQ